MDLHSPSASIKVRFPPSDTTTHYTHLTPLQSVNIRHQPPSFKEAMSPTLSTLPLETVIQILKSLADRKTLYAAVRSFSHLHRAYLISREVIFTAVTLRELKKRGVDVQRHIDVYFKIMRPESESEFPTTLKLHLYPLFQIDFHKHKLTMSNEQKYGK